MDENFKTFVISLKEQNLERRESVTKQLAKHDIAFDFVDAVVGKEIDIEKDARITEQAKWMRAGQIGCALSHFECYKKVVAEDLDYALILEDDMKILKPFNLTEILNQIKEENAIAFLYVGTYPAEKLEIENIGKNQLYKLKDGRPICTVAYIITNESCKRLLENAYPIISVSDDWDRFKSMGLIDSIYINYPLAVNFHEYESQIGYQFYGRKDKYLYYLQRWVKIPLLSNWIGQLRRKKIDYIKIVN